MVSRDKKTQKGKERKEKKRKKNCNRSDMKDIESNMKLFLLYMMIICLMNIALKCVDGFKFVHRGRRDVSHTYLSSLSPSSQVRANCMTLHAKKGSGKKYYIDNNNVATGHDDDDNTIDESQYSEWVEEEKQVNRSLINKFPIKKFIRVDYSFILYFRLLMTL